MCDRYTCYCVILDRDWFLGPRTAWSSAECPAQTKLTGARDTWERRHLRAAPPYCLKLYSFQRWLHAATLVALLRT